MNGYRSHIFEHHSQAGGVAAAWDRGDYLIDGGIHFSMGHQPGTGLHELYRAAWHRARQPLRPDHHLRPLHRRGHAVCGSTSHRTWIAWRPICKTLSPADGKLIDDLLPSARAMQGIDMSTFGMAKPPELTGRLDSLREMWGCAGHDAPHHGPIRPPPSPSMCATPTTHACKSVLENLFLPDVPVCFVSMLLALVADGQIAFIEGGCRDFVWAMEERYRDPGRGGDVRRHGHEDPGGGRPGGRRDGWPTAQNSGRARWSRRPMAAARSSTCSAAATSTTPS